MNDRNQDMIYHDAHEMRLLILEGNPQRSMGKTEKVRKVVEVQKMALAGLNSTQNL